MIELKKLRGRIHEAHNPIYNESLMIEIETLQWVLSQVDRSSSTLECVYFISNLLL